MPDGGIIRVRAENATVESRRRASTEAWAICEVSIEDQGVGIPEEHLQRIFDPYFTTKQKGSGLGLAISYSIIKRHGGYIAAESKVGAGTTVHIYLPASHHQLPQGAQVKDEKEEKPVTVKGKVLVMDDEELIRELVDDMLKNVGYEVTVAKDGAEAIEIYKRFRESGRPFDAVIMDLTVPGGMDGKEAIRRLMEIDPGVKAIVSSGYSSDPVMADFGKYGFRGVIAKPVQG